MTIDDVLDKLEELLDGLSIEIRYEKGDFHGGLYRYRDKQQMVINKDLAIEQKIRIIADEIRTNVEFDNLYLVPALREVIENASRVE
ncbi:MAG: hypothetical protein ACE5IY_13555 [bacterium]